jgi:hypothetical protein
MRSAQITHMLDHWDETIGRTTTMTDDPPHPMQPLVIDPHGTVRFRANAIIRWAVETGRIDLNEIATMPFDADDRMQLAQLVGYSVGGYSELGYVSDESYDEAERRADELTNTEEHSA